jgi:hypothetical protein
MGQSEDEQWLPPILLALRYVRSSKNHKYLLMLRDLAAKNRVFQQAVLFTTYKENMGLPVTFGIEANYQRDPVLTT